MTAGTDRVTVGVEEPDGTRHVLTMDRATYETIRDVVARNQHQEQQ